MLRGHNEVVSSLYRNKFEPQLIVNDKINIYLLSKPSKRIALEFELHKYYPYMCSLQ